MAKENISIEIFNAKSTSKPGVMLNEVSPDDTVHSLKRKISAIKHLSVDRISLRLEPRGKSIPDEQFVSQLNLPASNPQLFYRDLGPQIPWKTVFLFEYAGPFFIYPLFYLRPSFIYGSSSSTSVGCGCVATIALICHSLHYAKRLYETQFVHRFSNGTMPIRNLFKNCSYYWGFSAFIAYFVNHPLFTPPGKVQVFVALCCFIVSEIAQLRPQHYARFGATVVRSNKKKLIGAALGSGIMGGSLAWLIKDLLDSINEVIEDAEARKLLKQLFPVNFKFENSQCPARMEEFNNEWIFETAKNNWNKRDLAKICIIGNFSIHTLLRDLRPPGSKERKIPYPNSNPLTVMYNFVSCPNYTYEVASWISFTVLTQCLPAALFTLAGFLQMKQWANGKHRNYKKEFPNYPKNRTPIVPFIC